MNLIDRYIGKAIFEATLLALLVLIAMQSFIGFIGELRDIGTKEYGLMQALIYVPQTLPTYMYQFFPVAGLVGVLMGLGRLASRSELIVMRAAGISTFQVVISVLKTTLLMLIIVTVVGEWLAPKLQYDADKRKALEMTAGQVLLGQSGTWLRSENDFIHINHVGTKGKLQGITRYQFNQHRLVLASYANSAEFKNNKWIFTDVDQSTIGLDKITAQHFAQQPWNVTFDPHLLHMATIDYDQASLKKLYNYITYLKQNNQSSNSIEFEFWKRVFQPLATLIIIALGVPFIFGPLRTVTMGFRILTGIVVGFTFYTLNEFFGPISMVYQLPPLFAAAIPTLCLLLAAGLVLFLKRQ